ncbi:hypothetical protein GP486_008260 [Trichoglossum hirsutum]|uniref:Geranylgeranyl pyrophosphate synthetase n=1 Tax=Trichoglossum hirsutum TaxID=265104 RepID=A0A9P8L6F6_9PEZI|nr:hypothetical protein GP486_008260 [Trichoglossum hirsutum]
MPVKTLFKGVGGLLGEIPLSSVEANPDTSVALEDLTTLTSYNLMPKAQKTIVVPGSPSIWNPRELPTRIKPDSGSYPADHCRVVFPKCPLEPLIRAVLVAHPDFNLSDVDLISDRRNLRLLLDFVNGVKSEFRINAEVVGSTVLLSTWTERKMVPVKGFAGYGREFEKAWTKAPVGVEGSMAHHRIVRYSLGGIKVIMRFEVDGCMRGEEEEEEDYGGPSKEGTDTSTTTTGYPNRRRRHHRRHHQHYHPSYEAFRTPTGCTILTRGTLTAASRIIEIKTGRVGRNLTTSRNLAQLWFSQTPILCTGQYRTDGAFTHVSVKDVMLAGELSEWEERNRESLRKLVRLLELVREVVMKKKEKEKEKEEEKEKEKGEVVVGKCVLVFPQGGEALRVYGWKGGKGMDMGVPTDLVERWKMCDGEAERENASLPLEVQ